jgi:S-adenosylmethionine synthetase
LDAIYVEANSCGILSAIHEQSADINQGVDRSSPEEQGQVTKE